mmetsp:Transcript_21887/g.69912  ORF Transcript_21887/g.69912 Transcript_21887/m.69912 type:complete len:302 (-) Transcript_21887:45-950(-)
MAELVRQSSGLSAAAEEWTPAGGGKSAPPAPVQAASPVPHNAWSGPGAVTQHDLNVERVAARAAALLNSTDSTLCSVDVECVATGQASSDRAVARVAFVDFHGNVLLDRLVRPEVPVLSYLTALTGIEPGELDKAATLAEVRAELIEKLPANAVLVGQAIKHDIHWLELEQGVHFRDQFDIAELFQVTFPNGRSRVFSLRHEVLHLSGFEGAGTDIQAGSHDPCVDAQLSLRIFARYAHASPAELKNAQRALSRAPPTLPFWKTTPLIDGVQLGPASYYVDGVPKSDLQQPSQQPRHPSQQ